MRVSHSLIEAFMGCPLKGKFRYVDKLPSQQNARATWGTCVHQALALYNRTEDLEAAKETFLDLWANPEKVGPPPVRWPKGSTYPELRDKALEMLESYHDRVRWEPRQVLAIEHKFVVPFGEHTLSGIIDLLVLRNSAKGVQILSVEDYKTRSTKPTVLELQANTQFTFYLWATLQPEFWLGTQETEPVENGEWWASMLAETPRRAVWQHLWGGTEHDAGSRDQADFERAYRVACEVARAVEAGIFVPSISAAECTTCDYTTECGLRIRSPEEIREQEETWL